MKDVQAAVTRIQDYVADAPCSPINPHKPGGDVGEELIADALLYCRAYGMDIDAVLASGRRLFESEAAQVIDWEAVK